MGRPVTSSLATTNRVDACDEPFLRVDKRPVQGKRQEAGYKGLPPSSKPEPAQ